MRSPIPSCYHEELRPDRRILRNTSVKCLLKDLLTKEKTFVVNDLKGIRKMNWNHNSISAREVYQGQKKKNC